jgi:hypothetical protein
MEREKSTKFLKSFSAALFVVLRLYQALPFMPRASAATKKMIKASSNMASLYSRK